MLQHLNTDEKGTFRCFGTALAITLLLAMTVCGLLLALVRMEETINSSEFTLFSLSFDEDGWVELMALDRGYLWKLTDRKELICHLEQVLSVFPTQWRLFAATAGEIVGQISGFVEDFL